MPSATCTNCKSVTNSALSNYWMPIDGNGDPKEISVVTMCYAAYDQKNDKWAKGCSYDRCHILRAVVDKLVEMSGGPAR